MSEYIELYLCCDALLFKENSLTQIKHLDLTRLLSSNCRYKDSGGQGGIH